MSGPIERLFQNQVIRFLALGGFAAAVNWLIRIPLSLALPIEAAVILAYAIGMSVGFTLYRQFVFPGSSRPVTQQATIFLAVNLVGAVVVLALTLMLISAQTGMPYAEPIREALAHGIAIGVGAVVNFFGHKTLTFSLSAGQREGRLS